MAFTFSVRPGEIVMIGSIAVSVKAKPSRQACCKEKPKLQVDKYFWLIDSLTVFYLDAIFGSFQLDFVSGVIFRNKSATNDLVRKQRLEHWMCGLKSFPGQLAAIVPR